MVASGSRFKKVIKKQITIENETASFKRRLAKLQIYSKRNLIKIDLQKNLSKKPSNTVFLNCFNLRIIKYDS